jgi:uncharacterized protein (TIGR02268 family)
LLQTSFSPFALASLLVGLAATAQAAPRSVVLTGKAGESHLIYLAPDTVTNILLGAQIVRESVEVEGRARLAIVDVGDFSITLSPKVPLKSTEQLAVRVSFREGSPASVVFFLTGHASEADTVVSVSRPQQPLEGCPVELSATRERCEAQSQELEALRARPPSASPAAVALAGLVNEEGVRVRNIRGCSDVKGGFRAAECKVLAASTWVVVVLEVRNTGAEPWTPAWAEFTPAAGGEPRRARTVLAGQASIPLGGTVSVSVEVEMPAREPEEWLRTLHTLRVCDAAGRRCLSLPKVKL